jgi:hypothetical protein
MKIKVLNIFAFDIERKRSFDIIFNNLIPIVIKIIPTTISQKYYLT